MPATREAVRDRIDELQKLIDESRKNNDTARVSALEEERRILLTQLNEMNSKSGQILTDSPIARRDVLKG